MREREAVLLVSYLCIHFFFVFTLDKGGMCVCVCVCVCMHVWVGVKNGADKEVKWKLLRYTT